MRVTVRDAFVVAAATPDARVVIDVFRASTTVISLLEVGVSKLLVANELEVLKRFAAEGYVVVSEVFDLGLDNSPTLVRRFSFETGKAILKTTNLTTAIEANAFRVGCGGEMFIAGFNNLGAIAANLKRKQVGWVEILPAGSMGQKKKNSEDSHCAEILAAILKGEKNAIPSRSLLETRIQEKLQEEARSQHYIDDLYQAIELDRSTVVPGVEVGAACFRVVDLAVSEE